MQKVPETPGPLRDNDLQPDDVVLNQQQPVPPKGNQDEQSRSAADHSDELEEEEMEDELNEDSEKESDSKNKAHATFVIFLDNGKVQEETSVSHDGIRIKGSHTQ